MYFDNNNSMNNECKQVGLASKPPTGNPIAWGITSGLKYTINFSRLTYPIGWGDGFLEFRYGAKGYVRSGIRNEIQPNYDNDWNKSPACECAAKGVDNCDADT